MQINNYYSIEIIALNHIIIGIRLKLSKLFVLDWNT